jgi:hypothetical protein
MKSVDSTAIISGEGTPGEPGRATKAARPGILPRTKQMDGKQATRCLDDEAWDLIFRTKFLDPDYYASRPPKSSSALAS